MRVFKGVICTVVFFVTFFGVLNQNLRADFLSWSDQSDESSGLYLSKYEFRLGPNIQAPAEKFFSFDYYFYSLFDASAYIRVWDNLYLGGAYSYMFSVKFERTSIHVKRHEFSLLSMYYLMDPSVFVVIPYFKFGWNFLNIITDDISDFSSKIKQPSLSFGAGLKWYVRNDWNIYLEAMFNPNKFEMKFPGARITSPKHRKFLKFGVGVAYNLNM